MQDGFTKCEKNGLVYITPEAFDGAGGITAVFTTRKGGVSPKPFDSLNLAFGRGDSRENVLENFSRISAAAGINVQKIVKTKQIHETTVAPVNIKNAGAGIFEPELDAADGICTDTPGLGLCGFFADCVPVLLYDPARRAVAVVHAGWRGTAGNIAAAGIKAMKKYYGCNPSDIIAAIGPAIGKCCFETDSDVPRAMSAYSGYISQNGDKYNVDLKNINAFQLCEAGVKKKSVSICGLCTACESELFYSHRRDGAARGSLAAIIALN